MNDEKNLKNNFLFVHLQNYDGLIVRSDTKVTADVIEAGTRLKVIGRAGAGVDNIDINAASAKNVLVLKYVMKWGFINGGEWQLIVYFLFPSTPGGNAISACEMTCALITNLARNVAQAAESMRAGRWDRKLYAGHELYGKTLAIIGLGRIGKEVAIRMQSWGMKVILFIISMIYLIYYILFLIVQTIGYDPIVPAEEAKKFNVESMELEKIWPLADYITVHTPLIPATRSKIDHYVI